jgi:YjbE family integral membrane protein
LSIILIDLVLGGDNAIVIGMACRSLPEKLRLKGIILGTVGAVGVRVAATVALVFLLNADIYYVMLIGGIALVFIGCKLMLKEDEGKEIKAADSLRKAVMTVIAADAVMGIDNMLAVAGTAHGHPVMVIIGLAISVPIMIFGSTLVVKLMKKFPFIVYIGAGVILYTAGDMIVGEPLIEPWFEEHVPVKWALIIGITAIGLLFGFLMNRRKDRK